MKKFSLIGNPISHSKSPALFRAAYKECEFSYNLIEEPTIEESMNSFEAGGYCGANITSPFKESIMSYIQYPDIISSKIGAANTIIKGPNGLQSYNTDYYGVTEIIKEIGEKRINTALVIGGGGAGKAAALALKDSGINVTIANRTLQKIALFAEKVRIKAISLDSMEEYIKESEMIIYALSMPIEQLNQKRLKGKIILEANYATPNYRPEKEKSQEITYICGKKWLLYQAVKAFELFTGSSPNILAMRKIV